MGRRRRGLVRGRGGARYRIVDHTADIGLRARGATRGDLFANAAKGLASVMCDLRTVNPTHAFTIATEGGPTDEELLVAFLSDVLYASAVERLLFRDFAVRFPAPGRVEAEARGEPLSIRHSVEREVKAVTYHQAWVRRRRGVWEAQVILDI